MVTSYGSFPSKAAIRQNAVLQAATCDPIRSMSQLETSGEVDTLLPRTRARTRKTAAIAAFRDFRKALCVTVALV